MIRRLASAFSADLLRHRARRFFVVLSPVFWILVPVAAFALSDQFTNAEDKVKGVYEDVRDGVLFIAGAALFGCGAAALTGRMPWKWFWTLGGGIFLIAVAGLVVNEITGKGDVGANSKIF